MGFLRAVIYAEIPGKLIIVFRGTTENLAMVKLYPKLTSVVEIIIKTITECLKENTVKSLNL
jgi:hypothetical protein